MKRRIAHNRKPEEERYVTRTKAISFLQFYFPYLIDEDLDDAIKAEVIKKREKIYEYQRGERIIKQKDIRYCIADIRKWASSA